MNKPHVRMPMLLLALVLAAAALVGCGGSDDPEAAEPTAEPATNTPAPEPEAEPTAEPAPEPTATPLPTISAPTVPTAANGTCDRVPFSVWNADNGNELGFGTLDQFEFVDAGTSRFGGYTCEGDVLSITLKDGDTLEAVYTPGDNVLTMNDIVYAYNEAESFFQD